MRLVCAMLRSEISCLVVSGTWTFVVVAVLGFETNAHRIQSGIEPKIEQC